MSSRRWSTCSSVLVLLVASVASPERATELLDPIETALQTASVALEGDDTKAGKKQRKAATRSLGKLAKDTASELADVKLLKKIAPAVLKAFEDDAAVTQPILDAADAVDAGISEDLDSARALLPVGKKVTPSSVSKGIGRAQKLLDKSRAKTKAKSRIAVLFKARKAADKALAAAQKLEPTGEPERYDALAYALASDQSGALRLVEVDLDSRAENVIDTGTGDTPLDAPFPRQAPDGRALAFQRGDRMVLVEFEGGPTATLSSLASDWEHIAWSPDSTLAAVSGSGPDTLAVFDRDGNTVRSLAEGVIERGVPDEDVLLWSPDGSHLAFRTDRDTNGVREVQVLELATGTLTEVSSTNLISDAVRFVAWSHLGDKVVYVADEDRQSAGVEVVVVNRDGLERTLVSAPGEDVRDSDVTSSIRVDPASERVLYEFRSDGMGHLGTVALDGSERHTIATASANFFRAFEWSPDGTRVAYNNDGALHSCAPDGTDNVLITATCPDFKWARDGSALLYRVGNGGTSRNELFACSPDGSDPLRLSPDLGGSGNVGEIYACTELPDALAVYFVADSEENDRPDLHIAVVQDDAPAKVSTAFLKRMSSQMRFTSGAYEMKQLDAWPFSKDVDGRIDILYVAVTICNSATGETFVEYYRFSLHREQLGLIPGFAIPVTHMRRISGSEEFEQLVIDPNEGILGATVLRGTPFISRPPR